MDISYTKATRSTHKLQQARSYLSSQLQLNKLAWPWYTSQTITQAEGTGTRHLFFHLSCSPALWTQVVPEWYSFRKKRCGSGLCTQNLILPSVVVADCFYTAPFSALEHSLHSCHMWFQTSESLFIVCFWTSIKVSVLYNYTFGWLDKMPVLNHYTFDWLDKR